MADDEDEVLDEEEVIPEEEIAEDEEDEEAEEEEAEEADTSEEETYRQRYDNLVTKLGAQGAELGELRKFRDEAAPIIEKIQRGEHARPEPVVDERQQAAQPIANRKYQKLVATGQYTSEEAVQEAWDYALDIVDAAGGIAEQKVAKLTPSIERAGRGVIAEEVTGILAEAGIDGVTFDDIKAEFTGVGVAEWQAADPLAIKSAVIRVAKAARNDKIDAGTFTPKARARPKAGDNVAVDGATKGNGKGDTSRYSALADQMNSELGVAGLTAEQLRAAEARWQAKGGK